MKIEKSNPLKGRKVLVIATGSIAVVKTPILISNLIKAGAEVISVVTPSAAKLVSPLSLSTLSRNRCYQDQDQWDPKQSKPLHISLAEWAELVVVAPLSASSLARWVNGLAEGLVASLLLACEKPIIAAAAMNTSMWSNNAVQKNWESLQTQPNLIALSPSTGLLACDRIGEGKITSPELIQLAAESTFIELKTKSGIKQDWQGLRVLVTAGPTVEDLDPTRLISNRSSGQMGVFLAQAARFRGAKVDLIHGPLQISSSLLEGLNTFQIRTSAEMQKSIYKLQTNVDVIAMAAAITDFRKQGGPSQTKIDKESLLKIMKNTFEMVPDLLTELTNRRKTNQLVLGFSALTGNDENIKQLGLKKKKEKGCDLLLANPIDRAHQGLESTFNGGWLIGEKDEILEVPTDFKISIAHFLLDELLNLLKKS